MNKIEEAIDLLQQGVDVGDKPEGEIMQQAIDILSEPGSEREPGEFTKELDTFHNNQPTITLENIAFYVEFARNSAKEIDRLTAENARLVTDHTYVRAEIAQVKAKLKAQDEAHKNEIFKMNDICVSLCRTKDEAIGLLNGMVLVGIKHSDASRKIVEDALKG